jgi:NADH-quinone oxidoreductase subunit J
MDFLPTSLAEVPLNQIVFYVLAFVAVVSALQVVLQKSPLYAALNLIVTLVSLALIFAQLSAGFLAAVQVIVYAGAIVVLFIFIIMLLNLTDDGGREFRAVPMKVVGAVLVGVIALGVLSAVGSPVVDKFPEAPEGFGSIEQVGHSLFGEYVLPFELSGLLLLVAIVGTIVLARRQV